MSEKSKIKKFWDKTWFFLWKDPSMKGWIVSIVFIFIMIKFIFFPVLSAATGTALPLAIVESCSMYHENNIFSNFDNWWTQHSDNYKKYDITKAEFSEGDFTKGFTKGDILFITGVKPENIKIGDIIIYNAIGKDIIHRVVNITREGDDYIFQTMGDNVGHVQSFEERITPNQLVGKAQARLVPYLGWVKLIFYEPSRSPSERGMC